MMYYNITYYSIESYTILCAGDAGPDRAWLLRPVRGVCRRLFCLFAASSDWCCVCVRVCV